MITTMTAETIAKFHDESRSNEVFPKLADELLADVAEITAEIANQRRQTSENVTISGNCTRKLPTNAISTAIFEVQGKSREIVEKANSKRIVKGSDIAAFLSPFMFLYTIRWSKT